MKRFYLALLAGAVTVAAGATPLARVAKANLLNRAAAHQKAAKPTRHIKAPVLHVEGETATETTVEIAYTDLKANGSVNVNGFVITTGKGEGETTPALQGDEMRLYANNTISISGVNVTKVVFTLAQNSKMTQRYSRLTPSTGSINPAQAKGDTEVNWSGDASSVTFTVGALAEFGSQSSKAGQFHFTSITITGIPGEKGAEPEPTPNPGNGDTWTRLEGKGKYAQSVLPAMYGEAPETVEVDVYQSNEHPGLYKFVNVWPTFGDNLELVVDATDPDYVIVPVQYTGFDDDVDGKTYIASISALYSAEDLYENDILKFTDGCIEVPADALALNWPEAPADSYYETDPEEWSLAQNCPDGYFLLPGGTEPDPNKNWKSVGMATLQDGWVLPAIGVDQKLAENMWEVELQQSLKDENVYRLVDPYHCEGCPAAAFNESTRTGYIQFDITNPDAVVFATSVSAGFANSQMDLDDFYCSNSLGTIKEFADMFGLTLEEMLEEYDGYQWATYKDGVITLPFYHLVDTEEGYEYDGMYSDACYGVEAGDTNYGWFDDNDEPIDMEAKIWFPTEFESIREVGVAAECGGTFYNLRGQRVSKPAAAGIYIVNNRKVLVK